MHSANIKSSKRLQRVLNVLKGGNRVSTLDIIKQANVCAVSSCVSEIRDAGYNIQCQREGDRWYYQLAG